MNWTFCTYCKDSWLQKHSMVPCNTGFAGSLAAELLYTFCPRPLPVLHLAFARSMTSGRVRMKDLKVLTTCPSSCVTCMSKGAPLGCEPVSHRAPQSLFSCVQLPDPVPRMDTALMAARPAAFCKAPFTCGHSPFFGQGRCLQNTSAYQSRWCRLSRSCRTGPDLYGVSLRVPGLWCSCCAISSKSP